MDELLLRNIDRMIVERDELEQELFKCRENRKSNLATIKRLENSLRQIASGDGYYGAQAREYKQIACAALGITTPMTNSVKENQ